MSECCRHLADRRQTFGLKQLVLHLDHLPRGFLQFQVPPVKIFGGVSDLTLKLIVK